MKKVQGYAAGFFVFAVMVLGVISILGIWKFFSSDVIWKSFETLGLLAVVSIIVIVSGRFIEPRGEDAVIYVPNPGWKSLRKGTLGLLIASVSVLALMGVLTIWDVINEKDVLYKSLGSVAVLAFCAFIVVLTCLEMERDHNTNTTNQNGQPNKGMSGGTIAAIVIACFIIFPWLFNVMFYSFR